MQSGIPLCDVLRMVKRSIAGCQTKWPGGHVSTRRFNPSHQYIHKQIQAGAFNIQPMDGKLISFSSHQHECAGPAAKLTDHSVVALRCACRGFVRPYQCGSPIVKANAIQGSTHPALGIALDMSIQLRRPMVICTLSLL